MLRRCREDVEKLRKYIEDCGKNRNEREMRVKRGRDLSSSELN